MQVTLHHIFAKIKTVWTIYSLILNINLPIILIQIFQVCQSTLKFQLTKLVQKPAK